MAYAQAGIVTLIYDRRETYLRATANYQDLADDALSALMALSAFVSFAYYCGLLTM